MTRHTLLVGAVATLLGAAAAFADEPPRVTLPAGSQVRPGRPVVVRVTGGADRVRGGEGPWSLPQGERGDEFVLPVGVATGGRLDVTVERRGATTEASVHATVIDDDGGAVRAVFGAAGPLEVRVPTDDLPTVREAWLPFDAVAPAPDGASRAAREALGRFERLGARTGGAAPWCEPFALPIGLDAFRALAEVDAQAPRVPSAPALAAGLAAAAAALLAAATRRRRPSHRAAWTAAPVALFLAWTTLASPLPGDAHATALALVGDDAALVVVRVVAWRDTVARFDAPPGATSIAQVRFAPDDPTGPSVSVGRAARLELKAGESRVLAYALPLGPDDDREDLPAADVGPALAHWLGVLRVVPAGAGRSPVVDGLVPRRATPPCVIAPAVRVAPGK